MKGIVKMASTKVKKTWITKGEFETLIDLCETCEDKEFIKFIKEHSHLSFPKHYFSKFCWIKFRFDDLLFQWNNCFSRKETLLEYMKITMTYPEYYNEEEDCLDFGDFDIKKGCYINEQPTTLLVEKNNTKVRVEQSKSDPKFIDIRTSSSKEVDIENNKKDLELLVSSYDQVPLAMKCILWSLKNEPQTTYSLYSNIQFIENGSKRKFSTEEYKNILNPIIEQAVKDNVLMLKKVPKDGKNVFLYYNPSNKRIGYFFDGKLYSVPELSLLTGVNENTLYYRLAKYNIYKAITGV
jgi:hypothetical protein